MSDRDALLAAILAHPDEDTPRLAFADYLDEHGDAPRAEFIRVQIELVRLREAEADLPEHFGRYYSTSLPAYWRRPHDTPERVALLKREAELLDAHDSEWRKGLPKYADNAVTGADVRFRRGFVGHATVPVGKFMKEPAGLWGSHPVESILLRYAGGHDRRKVATCAPLAALRELRLIDGEGDGTTLAPYAESPHLAGLRTLGLSHFGLTNDGAEALARSPHLRRLALDLDCYEVAEQAFANLLNSPFAARLRWLRPHRVGEWAPGVIADAPLAELRLLDLNGIGCGDAGVEALTRSKHLSRLVTLALNANNLADTALESLAAWPGLAGVRALTLGNNDDISGRGSQRYSAPRICGPSTSA